MLQLIYELRKNWRRTGGRDGWKSKVLQEVLADLKSCTEKSQCLVYLLSCCFTISNPGEPQSMIFGVSSEVGLHKNCLKIPLSGFGKHDVHNPIILFQVLANTS